MFGILPWQWLKHEFQDCPEHRQFHRHVHRLPWQHSKIQIVELFAVQLVLLQGPHHNICFFVIFLAVHKLVWHLQFNEEMFQYVSIFLKFIVNLPLERVRVSGPMSCSRAAMMILWKIKILIDAKEISDRFSGNESINVLPMGAAQFLMALPHLIFSIYGLKSSCLVGLGKP